MHSSRTWTINALNAEITAGRTSCEEIVRTALARASDPGGEGARTFRKLRSTEALKEAVAQDVLRADGKAATPLAGLPISIKDNIDFAGEPTRGACKLLEDAPRAEAHAAIVTRLQAAGVVIVGRTNMSSLRSRASATIVSLARPPIRSSARRGGSPAALRPARRFPSPMAWRPPQSAPTPAARCVSPPR